MCHIYICKEHKKEIHLKENCTKFAIHIHVITLQT